MREIASKETCSTPHSRTILGRLQRRIDKLLSPVSTKWPAGPNAYTAWRRLDKGGVTDIAEWIKHAAKPRLVILDTLAGVKPIRNQAGYAEDYDSLTTSTGSPTKSASAFWCCTTRVSSKQMTLSTPSRVRSA